METKETVKIHPFAVFLALCLTCLCSNADLSPYLSKADTSLNGAEQLEKILDLSSFLEGPVLIYRSGSLQPGSTDVPRALHYGLENTTTSFVGGGLRLEELSYLPKLGKFQTSEVTFHDGQSPEYVQEPKTCILCHGENNFPIWSFQEFYPGAFGSAIKESTLNKQADDLRRLVFSDSVYGKIRPVKYREDQVQRPGYNARARYYDEFCEEIKSSEDEYKTLSAQEVEDENEAELPYNEALELLSNSEVTQPDLARALRRSFGKGATCGWNAPISEVIESQFYAVFAPFIKSFPKEIMTLSLKSLYLKLLKSELNPIPRKWQEMAILLRDSLRASKVLAGSYITRSELREAKSIDEFTSTLTEQKAKYMAHQFKDKKELFPFRFAAIGILKGCNPETLLPPDLKEKIDFAAERQFVKERMEIAEKVNIKLLGEEVSSSGKVSLSQRYGKSVSEITENIYTLMKSLGHNTINFSSQYGPGMDKTFGAFGFAEYFLYAFRNDFEDFDKPGSLYMMPGSVLNCETFEKKSISALKHKTKITVSREDMFGHKPALQLCATCHIGKIRDIAHPDLEGYYGYVEDIPFDNVKLLAAEIRKNNYALKKDILRRIKSKDDDVRMPLKGYYRSLNQKEIEAFEEFLDRLDSEEYQEK